MSRLNDLLKSAAERGDPRGADATLDAARNDATHRLATGGAETPIRRPHQKTLGLLAAAALLIVAVTAVVVVGGSDVGHQVATSPGQHGLPTTTNQPSRTTAISTGQPCRTGPVDRGGVLAFYSLCTATDSSFGDGSKLPLGFGLSTPYPVYREADNDPTVQESVRLLVDGLDEHGRARGLETGFDRFAPSERPEVEVDVDDRGVAHFDFSLDGDVWDPGSLTGNELFLLLEPLYATTFRFADVRGIDRGSLCWDEADCTGVFTREEWVSGLLVDFGFVVYDDCTVADVWITPERCAQFGLLDGATGKAGVTSVTANDALSVRGGPGADYLEVGELAPASEITYSAAVAQSDDGDTWRFVLGPNDEVGWVNEASLKLVDDQETLITGATRPNPIRTAQENTTPAPVVEPGATPPPTAPPSPPATDPAPGGPGVGPVTTNPAGVGP